MTNVVTYCAVIVLHWRITEGDAAASVRSQYL